MADLNATYSPKFSQFHTVFWKAWQNRMLSPPPPPGGSLGNPESAPEFVIDIFLLSLSWCTAQIRSFILLHVNAFFIELSKSVCSIFDFECLIDEYRKKYMVFYGLLWPWKIMCNSKVTYWILSNTVEKRRNKFKVTFLTMFYIYKYVCVPASNDSVPPVPWCIGVVSINRCWNNQLVIACGLDMLYVQLFPLF